jgi:membrane protease YdiL (CAAX protease family)
MAFTEQGIKSLFSRLIKWKVNIKWYIISLLTAPLLAILILLLLSFFSPDFYIAIIKSNNTTALISQGLAAGLMVGIFEEIGWSGFVIPKLGQRYNTIRNGFIVGILWGTWHFILFWESSTFTDLLPLFILIGRLFAWLPPYRIFMVWIYNRTESLLLTILTHMSLVFTVTAIVPMSLSGRSLLVWLLSWGTVLWIVIGLLIYANKDKQSIMY